MPGFPLVLPCGGPLELLPNPVDLEQREGRVHRYHGHVIRKNIAQALGDRVSEQVRAEIIRGEFLSPWDLAYRFADDELGDDGGRIPLWVFPKVMPGYSGILRCCLYRAMQLASTHFGGR